MRWPLQFGLDRCDESQGVVDLFADGHTSQKAEVGRTLKGLADAVADP